MDESNRFEEPAFGKPWKIERLSFKVRIARTAEVLQRVQSVRVSANKRHGKDLKDSQAMGIDPEDTGSSSVVVFAEDKTSGVILASMRIEDNFDYVQGIGAAPHLASMYPPAWREIPAIYVSSFAAKAGCEGRISTLACYKSAILYGISKQAKVALATAEPPRHRLFEPIGFRRITKQPLTFPHYRHSDLAVLLYAFDLDAFLQKGKETNGSVYKAVFETHHPDIEVFSSVYGPGKARRQGDQEKTVTSSSTQLGNVV